MATEFDGLPLFAHIPYSNPTTSRDAAETVRPHLAELEQKVLDAIRARRGATCDEVETMTGLSHQTASARIRGLALKGRIQDAGETRATRSGRKAIVWTTAA